MSQSRSANDQGFCEGLSTGGREQTKVREFDTNGLPVVIMRAQARMVETDGSGKQIPGFMVPGRSRGASNLSALP